MRRALVQYLMQQSIIRNDCFGFTADKIEPGRLSIYLSKSLDKLGYGDFMSTEAVRR